MDKIAFYKEEIEKRAGIGATIAKGLAGAVKSFAGSSAVKRVATGAAVGAAAKGITYNPNNGGSRLGSMASGALTGGLVGGAISPSNINALGKGVSNLGEKAVNSAASKSTGFMSNAMGNAGIYANTVGNKIQNTFPGVTR